MSVGKMVTGILLTLMLFPLPQFAQALSIPVTTDTTTTTTSTVVASPSSSPSASLDTTGPVVSAVAPRVAVVGTAATFSATVSDAAGTVSSCALILVNSAQVTTRTVMTVTTLAAATTASVSYTFKDAGKYVASLVCKDSAGNSTQGTTAVVVVSAAATTTAADTTAPTIGTVTPSTATVGTVVSVSATVSDNVSVSSCTLILTDSSQVSVRNAMTLATSVAGITSASFSQTFTEAGAVRALIGCADPSGNRGSSVAISIVVSAAASTSTTTTLNTVDTTGPTVGVVSPLVATVGTAQTFSTTVSDSNGISSCFFILTNSAGTVEKTAMTVTALAAATTASLSYTFKDSGSFGALVSCKDPGGNAGAGKSVAVVVSAAASTTTTTQTTTPGGTAPTTTTTSTTDTLAPKVSAVSPLVAIVGTAVKLVSAVSDDVAVVSCGLALTDSAGTVVKAAATLQQGTGTMMALLEKTFKVAGTYGAVMTCLDAAKNSGTSTSVNVVVSAAGTTALQTPASSSGQTPSGTTDTTAPTVGAVSPLVAVVGTVVKLASVVSDDVAVVSCALLLTDSTGTVVKAAATVQQGTGTMMALLEKTFKVAGTYGAVMTCLDAAKNSGSSTSVSIVVSAAASTTTTTQTPTTGTTTTTTTPTTGSTTNTQTTTPAGTTSTTDTLAPSVGAVSPLIATVGTLVKLVSVVSDDVAVVSCVLVLTDSTASAMKAAATLQQSSGTMVALVEKTFKVAGTYGAVMTCLDATRNKGTSTSVDIVVSAAASTTTQTPTTGTTTTTTQTPTSSTEQTSTATDTALAVGQLTPVLATVGTVVPLKAPISGTTTLNGMVCTFVLTNSDKAISTFAMTTKALPAITIATIDFTFKKTGVYTAFAACTDSAGTSAKGKPVTITVGAASTTTPATGTTTNSTTTTDTSTTPATGSTTTTETGTTPASTTTTQTPAATTTNTSTSSDVTAPIVGDVTPVQTNTGDVISFSATVTDDSGETGLSCVIAIAFGRTPVAKLPATIANGIASAVYKFAKPGSYFATAMCSDAAKNRAVGVETTVVVTDAVKTGITLPAKSNPSKNTTGSESTTTTPGTSTTTETSTTGTSTSTTTTAPETTTTTTTTPVADTLPPMIGKVIPKDATVGISVRIGAIATDNVAVTSCTYSLDEVDRGLMTLDKGKVYADYAFINAGDHTIIIFCADAAGNVGKSKIAFVRVGDKKDTTAPLVGTVPAVAAVVVDAPITVSVTYVDNIGVTQCIVFLDTEAEETMALNVGIATAIITVKTDGSHTLYVGCEDAAGNVGASVEATTFDVAKATGDLTVPTIGSVSPLIATQNSAVTFSVSAADDSDVSSCSLFVDNANQGEMTLDAATPTFSRSYTFAEAGTFSVYADCIDAVGNDGIGGSVDVVVSAAEETLTDTVAPTVGAITPSSTIATVATTLSASVSDSEGVASCELYVDSVDVGAMTVANGTASYLYTFTQSGTAVANAYCKDAAGNATQGDSTFITVEDAAAAIVPVVESVTNTSATAEPGNLIKLACYSNSDVNDPCKAVYFYSAVDGSRHVFPNENAYFTWFTDFDSIVVVSDDFMKSLTIGTNIVYRPGVRLVKFDSMNKVYAVMKGGMLRPIDSEATAAVLYGSDWSTKVDGISDAFFGNYRFGDVITADTSYNPSTEKNAVPTIDANLE